MSEQVTRAATTQAGADHDILVELCVIAAEFEGLFQRLGLAAAADAAFDLFEALEEQLAALPYASVDGASPPLSLSSS